MTEVKKPHRPRSRRKAEIYAEVRDVLVKRFPLAFMPQGSPKIPLKVGIARDVIERCPDIPMPNVKLFFGDYAGGYRYQQAILAGEHRFDLDGKIAGQIIEEHKERARQILAKHQAHRGERRQVQHG